jgi:hypothetical protein
MVFQKKFCIRLLGTMFTNAISCFEPGSQVPYRDIFETPFSVLNRMIMYIPEKILGESISQSAVQRNNLKPFCTQIYKGK